MLERVDLLNLRGARPATAEQTYFPFIDGLRAIAVLAVVAFHVGIPGTAAGYLGVDIFFVISGFLILGAVHDDLRQNRFSAATFFAKRALRLFPLMAIVIGSTALAIPFFPVLPTEAEQIRSSAQWAVLFGANLFFAQDANGYFATASESKPLLHLWSLAVEEQFYFVTAIIAAAAAASLSASRAASLATCIAICIGIVSAGLWIATVTEWSASAFYLLPWRAWEFLIGAAAAFALRRRLVPHTLAFVGVGMLVFGLAFFTSTDFVLGALTVAPASALILAACAQDGDSLVAKALSNPVLAFIGKVSYGWYLWHWPVLFYVRTTNLGHAHRQADLCAAVISFALAVLTFWTVERPLQAARKKQRPAVAQLAIFTVCVAGLYLSSVAANYTYAMYLNSNREAIADHRRASWPVDKRAVEEKVAEGGIFSIGKGEPKVVAWGDSHARAILTSIAELSEATRSAARVIWSPSCLPTFSTDALLPQNYTASCRKVRSIIRRALPETATGIVIAAYWVSSSSQPAFEEEIRHLLATLVYEKHYRVLLIGQIPTFSERGADCVYRSVISDRSLKDCDVNRSAYLIQRSHRITESLMKIARSFPHVRVIDPIDLLCTTERCSPVVNGRSMLSDQHHLNSDGAKLLFERFKPEFTWAAEGSAGTIVAPIRSQ